MPVMAQTSDNTIADTLMGSNKLIAVIAVICIILIGIVAFLFSQENRIRKLEEEVKQKSQ
jgi:CHASE3 domain sensor protein